MGKIAFYVFILMFAALPYAYANDEGYVYSPEGCEFTATFPAEPGFVNRCPSDRTMPCFEVAQFTDRADIDQTINVEMSCQIITEEAYESYNQQNMEDIILNLVRDANLPNEPVVMYEEQEGMKLSGASGIKTTGFATKIFITQLWVKNGSIMTVEGEMSLEGGEEVDKKFADILHSIRPKDQQVEAEQAEAN